MDEPQRQLIGRPWYWISQAGKLRDGFLVLAGILYILGYAIWLIDSAVNGLGLLPAVQAQYFTAGLGPALILATLLILIRYGDSIARRVIRPIADRNEGIRRALLVVLVSLLALVAWRILSALDESGTLSGIFAIMARLIGILAVSVAFVGILLFAILLSWWTRFPSSQVVSERLLRPGVGQYSVLAIIAMLLYAFVIYPNWPQSLGGVRPRCAYIDIVSDRASQNTIRSLIPIINTELTSRGVPRDHRSVVRSVQLDVFYADANAILARPHLDFHESSGQPTFMAVLVGKSRRGADLVQGVVQAALLGPEAVYEIKRDMTEAVMWCSP